MLVVGATGPGKSGTLAAMIDYRNKHRSGHILTIEDPIEFVHQHSKSIVDQREVGFDTNSCADALQNALRESPDVVMTGEIRDRETMQQALQREQPFSVEPSAVESPILDPGAASVDDCSRRHRA